MYLPSPLEVLSRALASAVYTDLPDIKEYHRDLSVKLTDAERQTLQTRQKTEGLQVWPGQWKSRRPSYEEVTVVGMFAQDWASTALGFGGVGGQAASQAYSIVLESHDGTRAVYFNAGLAYIIGRDADGKLPAHEKLEAFQADMGAQRLADVMQAGRRYGAKRG